MENIDDEIRLWARITAQESLLVEIWANFLSKLPDPYGNLKTMEGHTRRKVHPAPADVDKDYAAKFSAELTKVYKAHWRRVHQMLDDDY